jgi:hypothetical protein
MVIPVKSRLVKCTLIFALGFALAHGQQFTTNCTDVKVEIAPDPSKIDTVCIVTLNGNVTYQRQYVGYGLTNVGTISGVEAQKLLDKKAAWVSFGACREVANHKPRKERKQGRLDCEGAFRIAQPELAASIEIALGKNIWTK